MADEAIIDYREIPSYPGYRVGNDGSIWSRHRKGPGEVLNDGWHRLKPVLHNNGYLEVSLSKRGKIKTFLVHVLVLKIFIGPRPEGMIARHFPDSDRTNCAVANLRWGTHEQNAADRTYHGHTVHGESNNNAKLTEADIPEIRAARGRGCVSALARRFGVSRQIIWKIRKYQLWKHVP